VNKYPPIEKLEIRNLLSDLGAIKLIQMVPVLIGI
jgi:hypothetical protein